MATSSKRGADRRGLATRSEPDYRFDFCGGHVAIDFTNTVGDRGGDPREHFNNFADIVAWAEARGIVTPRAAATLRHEAASNPDNARRAHRHAVELREALYGVLDAIASKRPVRSADLDVVNRHVSATFEGATLSASGARFTLDTPPYRALQDVLRPVVRAAVD